LISNKNQIFDVPISRKHKIITTMENQKPFIKITQSEEQVTQDVLHVKINAKVILKYLFIAYLFTAFLILTIYEFRIYFFNIQVSDQFKFNIDLTAFAHLVLLSFFTTKKKEHIKDYSFIDKSLFFLILLQFLNMLCKVYIYFF